MREARANSLARLVIFSGCIILSLASCHNPSSPAEGMSLVISSGSYEPAGFQDPYSKPYRIRFEYYADGGPIVVDMYTVALDSTHHSGKDWYPSPTITAGKKYEVDDTLFFSKDPKTAPVLKLYGYLPGDSIDYINLQPSYVLHPKVTVSGRMK